MLPRLSIYTIVHRKHSVILLYRYGEHVVSPISLFFIEEYLVEPVLCLIAASPALVAHICWK